MEEPNNADLASDQLTEQEIIAAWPNLAQPAYADLRSEIVKFTSAVQAYEKDRKNSLFSINKEYLIQLIGQLKERCIPEDLNFVKAVLTLAFPYEEGNNFNLVVGFILGFNLAYDFLNKRQILSLVKDTIQEAAHLDVMLAKDKVHSMYAICIALQTIAAAEKLEEKYKAQLLTLLFKLLTNNELKSEYDVSRFSEIIVTEDFIAADLNLIKALTKHGFKDARNFVMYIRGPINESNGRKLPRLLITVAEQHGFTGATELFQFFNRNLKKYEQRKILEPLLSLVTQWGYDKFFHIREFVEYLYIAEHPPGTIPILEYWRDRCIAILGQHGNAGINKFQSVLQSSLRNSASLEGKNLRVELAKQALLEPYLVEYGFVGVLDYYVTLPICYDPYSSATASISAESKKHERKTTSSVDKGHETSLSSVENEREKESRPRLDEQNNNTVTQRPSSHKMSELDGLIITVQQVTYNATSAIPVTEPTKSVTDNSLFSTKSFSRFFQTNLQLDQKTDLKPPRDQKSEQEISSLESQLYFLRKLRDLLKDDSLAQMSIHILIEQAKENTLAIFKCENLITGKLYDFISSIDSEASNTISIKPPASMSA